MAVLNEVRTASFEVVEKAGAGGMAGMQSTLLKLLLGSLRLAGLLSEGEHGMTADSSGV